MSQNKSKLYQHKIVEISFDQTKLSNFPVERGIGYILTENETNDKIALLRENLMEELYDIIYGDIINRYS